jgi:hypothetical protein
VCFLAFVLVGRGGILDLTRDRGTPGLEADLIGGLRRITPPDRPVRWVCWTLLGPSFRSTGRVTGRAALASVHNQRPRGVTFRSAARAGRYHEGRATRGCS